MLIDDQRLFGVPGHGGFDDGPFIGHTPIEVGHDSLGPGQQLEHVEAEDCTMEGVCGYTRFGQLGDDRFQLREFGLFSLMRFRFLP
jgi:hypothetical protein